MIPPRAERRALQACIALAGIVPVGAGLWGVLGHMHTTGVVAESHARYLSGLLLGIGLAFWALIPTIERQGRIVGTLTAIVALGGLARLAGAAHTGLGLPVLPPLIMELAVTPALALWRERVERRLR